MMRQIAGSACRSWIKFLRPVDQCMFFAANRPGETGSDRANEFEDRAPKRNDRPSRPRRSVLSHATSFRGPWFAFCCFITRHRRVAACAFDWVRPRLPTQERNYLQSRCVPRADGTWQTTSIHSRSRSCWTSRSPQDNKGYRHFSLALWVRVSGGLPPRQLVTGAVNHAMRGTKERSSLALRPSAAAAWPVNNDFNDHTAAQRFSRHASPACRD